jgi:hypothetical protein
MAECFSVDGKSTCLTGGGLNSVDAKRSKGVERRINFHPYRFESCFPCKILIHINQTKMSSHPEVDQEEYSKRVAAACSEFIGQFKNYVPPKGNSMLRSFDSQEELTLSIAEKHNVKHSTIRRIFS